MEWTAENITATVVGIGGLLTGAGAWYLRYRDQRSKENRDNRNLTKEEKLAEQARIKQERLDEQNRIDKGYERLIVLMGEEKTKRETEFAEERKIRQQEYHALEAKLNEANAERHQCREENAVLRERIRHIEADVQQLRAGFEAHRKKGHDAGEPETLPPQPSPLNPPQDK